MNKALRKSVGTSALMAAFAAAITVGVMTAACGYFASPVSNTTTTASGNVTSAGQGNGASTLSLDVIVTAEVAVTEASGAVTVIQPVMWTVVIADTLKNDLPNNSYSVTATFPDGSQAASGSLYARSWSFAPSLVGAYRIEAVDASGRTASMTKSREN